MKRGIKAEWNMDGQLEIRKSQGKLTLEEIEDVLLYGRDTSGNHLHGYYAQIYRCTEETCGGNGLFDIGVKEPSGDIVRLQPLYESTECPVCNGFTPPFEHCPHCFEKWDKEQ